MDIGTLLADETKTHRFNDLVERANAALADGVIYNADYQDLKFRLTRHVEDAQDNLRNAHREAYRNDDAGRSLFLDAMWEFGFDGFHKVAARMKKIAVARTKPVKIGHSTVEFPVKLLDLYDNFNTAILPIAQTMMALKPLIVKGRKPSDQPRKTPERTLENTGTCSICGQNVKLDKSGKIVHHGFTIRWGFRNGSCPGVGFDPIEVSTEGVVAYLDLLARVRTDREKALQKAPSLTEVPYLRKMLKAGDEGFDRALKIFIVNLESEIRHIIRMAETFKKVIAEWKPRPLPDQKGS